MYCFRVSSLSLTYPYPHQILINVRSIIIGPKEVFFSYWVSEMIWWKSSENRTLKSVKTKSPPPLTLTNWVKVASAFEQQFPVYNWYPNIYWNGKWSDLQGHSCKIGYTSFLGWKVWRFKVLYSFLYFHTLFVLLVMKIVKGNLTKSSNTFLETV